MKIGTYKNTRLTMNTSVSRKTGEIKEHEYSELVRAGGTRRWWCGAGYLWRSVSSSVTKIRLIFHSEPISTLNFRLRMMDIIRVKFVSHYNGPFINIYVHFLLVLSFLIIKYFSWWILQCSLHIYIYMLNFYNYFQYIKILVRSKLLDWSFSFLQSLSDF